MSKYYATITNVKTGNQFTIGEYSEKELQKTLNEIQKTGFENLDNCSVDVQKVEI